MENYTENFGSWQSNCSGAVSLVPAFAASNSATGVFAAGFALTDAAAADLGQPKTMRTHKYITRPGNPPRGRIR